MRYALCDWCEAQYVQSNANRRYCKPSCSQAARDHHRGKGYRRGQVPQPRAKPPAERYDQALRVLLTRSQIEALGYLSFAAGRPMSELVRDLIVARLDEAAEAVA